MPRPSGQAPSRLRSDPDEPVTACTLVSPTTCTVRIHSAQWGQRTDIFNVQVAGVTSAALPHTAGIPPPRLAGISYTSPSNVGPKISTASPPPGAPTGFASLIPAKSAPH